MTLLENASYRKVDVTILDYVLRYGEIDVQPVGQRLETEPKLESRYNDTKAQEIITSIMRGVDLGQITLHEKSPGSFEYADAPPVFDNGEWKFKLKSNLDTEGSRFAYESIDGGHRKRYIYLYYDDKFRWNGMYFSDLPPDLKKKFLYTKLTFAIYSNLSVYDIGYIFRSLNKTTDVNHQEMLNSYGDIPIANAVRNTVRPVRGVNNKIHSLFEFNQRDGKEKNFLNLSFRNKRLLHDKIVSRFYYRYYDGGGIGVADEESVQEMYEADLSQDEVNRLSNKVKKLLTFLEDIATEMKRGNTSKSMGQAELSLYSRIWLYMEKEYGAFKINDMTEFYQEINKAYAPYTLAYDKQPADLRQVSPWSKEETRGQAFKNVLGLHKDGDIIFTCLMWLLKEVDMTSLVTLKDPRRLFPRVWREAKLAEQGYKCAIDGKPLTMDEAHGGHITAHSRGGKTDYDNLAMISAYHNKRMGSMSIEQYKQLLELEAEAA